MKTSVWSLTCQQSVFQRYYTEKHLSEFYPQDGGENQLASKLRHCHPTCFLITKSWTFCFFWDFSSMCVCVAYEVLVNNFFRIRECCAENLVKFGCVIFHAIYIGLRLRANRQTSRQADTFSTRIRSSDSFRRHLKLFFSRFTISVHSAL